MRIGVIVRLIPDLGEEIELNAAGTALDMEWTDLKLNEFDEQALEEAILIAEGTQAEVVAMGFAVEGAERMLKTAIARGAHRAVKISCPHDGPIDSEQAAPFLAEAVKTLAIDLVLTGVQAADDYTGPLAGRLSALLDWPSACAVAGFSVADGRVTVRQEYAGGTAALLSLGLPAILGIQSASAPIRYVSGSKMGQAMSATLETLEPAAVAAEPVVQVLSMAPREAKGRAEMLEGSPASLALQLRDILKARGLWQGGAVA